MKQLSTDNINARITEKLSAEICPVHGRRPVISWDGDNMEARCCCDDFRAHIDQITESVAKQAALEEISNLLDADLDDCNGE